MMVQAKDIHKSFGSLHVLKGVSLEIQAGEVISIVGASGAGKTTLLQILGTLDKADQGALKIDGVDIGGLQRKGLSQFRNQKLGFIFQFHQLLPEFTALENICMPSYIAGKARAEAESRGRALLEYLRLSQRANHKPNELSGGEQQRVAVARALMNKPALILADEPSGNLDTESAENLHQLFFDLRDRFGHTFVIVTHNTQLAEMADRKLVMQNGLIMPS